MKPSNYAALLAVLLLAGCTPTATSTESDDSTGGEAPAVDESCLTGQWDLNVANYGEQSAAYLATLGVPFVDFNMSGTQLLNFSDDGGMELATDITAGGTITVPGFTGPVSTSTQSISAGNWSTADDGSLTIENWAPIGDDVVTSTAPEGVELGGFTLSNATGVTALCDETSLFLQGADAPLGSYWTRR